MIPIARRRPLSLVLAIASFASLAALAGACSSRGSGSGDAAPAPSAGARCDIGGERVCADAQTVLECRGNVWLSEPCHGKSGCQSEFSFRATCDDSVSKEGESCLVDKAGACSFDGATQLVCTGGKWAIAAKCPGTRACTNGYMFCDGAVATEKETCPMPSTVENVACAADGKTALHCAANAWARSGSGPCLGPQGCKVSVGHLSCDISIVKELDPCNFKGNIACSTDLKGLLECDGAVFRPKSACPKGKSCLPHSIVSTCE